MYADILQNNTVNFIASEIHLGGAKECFRLKQT